MTEEFGFTQAVRARAYALVCHDGGSMQDQDYSRAKKGLSVGLDRIHTDGFVFDKIDSNLAITSLRQSISNAVKGDDPELLNKLESLLLSTKARINPIVRIPLLATGSPEVCRSLLEIMKESPTNLALYLGKKSKEDVTATVIKFPRLFRQIPALADDELALLG